MHAVDGGEVVVAQQVARIDEIDVFVAFHARADLRLGHGLFFVLEPFDAGAEVAGLAADGLQEDQRRCGVRTADGVHERVEPLGDHFGARVGKAVEDECVGLDGGKIGREFGLHGALSAETQVDDIDARAALHARGVGHACASGRESVRDARSVEHDLVAKGVRQRVDAAPVVDADFECSQLVVNGQVEQALLFARLHVADQRCGVAVVPAVDLRAADSGEDPLPATADIEVEPLFGNRRHVGGGLFGRGLPAGADRAAVGAEHHGKAGGVVAEPEGLRGHRETRRVDAVVSKFGRQRFADKGQRRCVDIALRRFGQSVCAEEHAAEQHKEG